MTDVLFVGAGPVGLYTAIQAKLYNPKLTIKMFERYESYLRSHILIINKDSYKGSHPNKKFQAMLKDMSGPVPTKKIEAKLRGFAEELGIEIEQRRVDNITTLAKEYPKARTIVGSDGARSLVRREIFGDKKAVNNSLQYIVELKYKVDGKSRALKYDEYTPALSQTSHFIHEYVGKEKEGTTPVSLFFFVDKATYTEVNKLGGSAKKGIKLSDIAPSQSKNLYNLANSIRPWLAARRYATNEHFIDNSEKIAAVELPIYHSEKFIETVDATNYVLVGDAAMGVPYFRALNAGLIGANHAAKLISDNSPELKPGETKGSAFNREMTELAKKEISNAKWTNTLVRVGKGFAKVGRTEVLSKSSASILPPSMLSQMQDAQIRRPNILRRNPRTALALLGLIILGATLILTGGTAAFPIVGSFLASHLGGVFGGMALSSFITIIGCASFKISQVISSYFRKQTAEPHSPHVFPWEENERQTINASDSNSRAFANLAKSRKGNERLSLMKEHYNSPISSSPRSPACTTRNSPASSLMPN